MNSRIGWWRSPGCGGRLDDLVEHRPRVGGHGHPVAADLLPEGGGVELPRHGEPRAAHDRAADAHHEPRRVVDRSHAVQRVGAGERGRGGGAERRLRPPAVRDPAHPRVLALAAEHDEGQIAGAARVRPVPAWELHRRRVDPLHVDDALGAQVPRAAAAPEHERVHDAKPGGQGARSGSAMIRSTWPSFASRARSPSGRISTATAPIRLIATTSASALGRGPINTPTCSPWRTPIEIRPRTTLSIRSPTSRAS